MKLLLETIRTFKFNSVFIRYFLIMMLLTLIAVSASTGVAAHFYTKEMLKEQEKNNTILLNQTKSEVDYTLDRLQSLAIQSAMNLSLNRVLYYDKEEAIQKSKEMVEAIAYLNSVKINNDNLMDVWLYCEKGDYIISGSKYSPELYFSKVCTYEKEIDVQKMLLNGPRYAYQGENAILNGGREEDVRLFSIALPLNEGKAKGLLVFNLRSGALGDTIPDMEGSGLASCYMIDGQGRLIYTNVEQDADKLLSKILEKVDSEKPVVEEYIKNIRIEEKKEQFTVQLVKSKNSGWTYIYATPTSYIINRRIQLLKRAGAIAVFCILGSSVFAFYAAMHTYRPISQLLKCVQFMNGKKVLEKGKETNELKEINRMIELAFDEREHLQQIYDQSKPYLQDKLLSDLLNGQVTQEKLKLMQETAGLEFSFSMCQVLVVRTELIQNSEVIKITKIEKIEECVMHAAEVVGGKDLWKCYSLKKEENILVVLINAEAAFYEEGIFSDFVEELKRFLEEDSSLQYVIGIGKNYKGITNCYCSYIDALQAVKYRAVKGENTTIYAEEISDEAEKAMHYPVQKETQLITAAKGGNAAMVRMIILDVFEENQKISQVSLEQYDNLCQALVTSAIRTIHEMRLTVSDVLGDEKPFQDIRNSESHKKKQEDILKIFNKITEYVNQTRNTKQDKMLLQFEEYLAENYPNDISLSAAAEKAGLSPAYFSTVFKEKTGHSFVDYVSEYRINEAKRLLLETEDTLNEIAVQVGYYNANSLTKVFKKYTGVTPGQFRKSGR